MGKMKQITAFLLSVCLLLITSSAVSGFAETPFMDSLDQLSEVERTVLRADLTLARIQIENKTGWPVTAFPGTEKEVRLTDLTVEQIRDIEASVTRADEKPFSIDLYAEMFSSDQRISFCIFQTIQEISRALDWNVTQKHNPELLGFDAQKRAVSTAVVYLTYFGTGSREQIREDVEEYTEVVLGILPAVLPTVEMKVIKMCWQIPVINEESLYAASFWCTYDGNAFSRGEGSGLIY